MNGRTHVLACVAGLLLVCSGCGFFMPAHPNSEYVKHEKVILRMLRPSEMTDYADDWEKAFGRTFPKKNGTRMVVCALAPVVASLIGNVAVDIVKYEFEVEAKRYEATFGSRVSDEFFLATQANEHLPKYLGFELIRKCKEDKAKEGKVEEDKDVAFRVVYGICPSEKGELYMMAPLYLRVAKAKAKVLSDGAPRWVRPWCWLMRAGHELDVTIDTTITVARVTKDREFKVEQVGSFTTHFPAIDLNYPTVTTKQPAQPKPGDGPQPAEPQPAAPSSPPPGPELWARYGQLPGASGWFAVPRSQIPLLSSKPETTVEKTTDKTVTQETVEGSTTPAGAKKTTVDKTHDMTLDKTQQKAEYMDGHGAFTLSVLVTERDPSCAAKAMAQGAALAEKQREPLIKALLDMLTKK